MNLVVGTAEQIGQKTYRAMTAYRHAVFVERLGWDLDCPEGNEVDQFDRDDTVYVAATLRDSVRGCARLLPTSKPYLLGEVFPELLHGLPAPCSPDVWELSRFTVMSPDGSTAEAEVQLEGGFLPVLQLAIEEARKRGARRLITVSPVAIERLLRRAGVKAYRVAPPVVRDDGQVLCALWVDVT